MKLKVTFRAYTLPYVDPDTGEEERGEFCYSFHQEIEGNSVADIGEKAAEFAVNASLAEEDLDVRVWEIPVQITPRGINSL